jgi:molybdenum cofactor biosynthesis protein MoaF
MADLAGSTVRWTYADGPMKGKHFEHRFDRDGTVTWKEAGDAKPAPDSKAKYQFQRISDEVYVVSYLSDHGFTLTTVVDERSGAIVSFASNEKDLVVQRGTLERTAQAA